MKLYDEIIRELQGLLAQYREERITKNVDGDSFVWDSLKSQFFMKSDTAIELGGSNLPAASGILFTCVNVPEMLNGGEEQDETVDGSCRVTLYGPDLPVMRGNMPYGRVTLVRLREEYTAEKHKLYNLLRSIEYIRYHVNPRGYMPRISTVQNREQVRVSKEALMTGLDFYKVGRVYEEAYLKHPAVAAAETVFITLEQFDYRALQVLLDRGEEITMSLDHPLNRLKMDCGRCSLKPVCDEVEALCREGSGGKSNF